MKQIQAHQKADRNPPHHSHVSQEQSPRWQGLGAGGLRSCAIFVGLSHYTDPACPLEELFSRSHQVNHNSTAAPIPLILKEQDLQTAQVLDAGWVGCLSNNRRIFSAFLCFIYR